MSADSPSQSSSRQALCSACFFLERRCYRFFLLIFFRRLDRGPEVRSPGGDALIIWVMAFFFGAHALLLAVVIGALHSLHPALALAVAVLLLGIGALLPSLPPQSPFGLALEGLRDRPERWKRVIGGFPGA